MSTVSIRRTKFRPEEAAVGVRGDTVTVHVPGFAWQGTHDEFRTEHHDWSEALWSKYCAAVAHDFVLTGMLPKRGVR